MTPRKKEIWLPAVETPLDDRLYLYMKRLLLTAGMFSLEGYVRGKPTVWNGRPREHVLRDMLSRFSRDSNRSDVGTSKCMHCVFRHDCMLVPNQCPFLDDRTPEHKLSMEFSCRGERGMYDCGWLHMPSIGHVVVLVKDLGQYMSLDKGALINRRAPFSCDLCVHRAVPKPGETYEAYTDRVERAMAVLRSEMTDDGKSIMARMKDIVRAIGKEDLLRDAYEGDIRFFTSDYWPGMTMDEIIRMYGASREPTDRDYLKNRRRLEKEAEHGKDDDTCATPDAG